ncbi:heat shock protein HspQ [Beggiatoa alba]|nr:heat shock protein HspQ [Beggiatoa alba]
MHTKISQAQFQIGQIVEHLKFGYRGVVFEVDPEFSLPEAWYEQIAKSHPPKDKPWYHVLVDGYENSTYVAERHLIASDDMQSIDHPDLHLYFSGQVEGRYFPLQPMM